MTGGSGFIGAWTAEELLREGHEVATLDLLEAPRNDVEHFIVDVRDFKRYREVAKDYDAVVHLAAVVDVEEASERPLYTEEVNVRGTLNVLEVARERGQKVVLASSAAVYGEPKYVPIDEEHPLRPKSVYGATKASGDMLALSYSESFGVKVAVLRYFNVYGPSIGRRVPGNVIHKFLSRLLRNEPVVIYGDGSQVRDFVYVEDVAKANLIALERAEGIYNVGTGKGISILELLELIFKVTGRKTRVEFLPPRRGDIKESIADIKRVLGIGWRPSVSLEEGISRTWKWIRGSEVPRP